MRRPWPVLGRRATKKKKNVGLLPLACRNCGLKSHRGTWASVCCECCVLLDRSLGNELITRPERSYRLWCVVVCSRNLVNEEALAHWGAVAPKTNKHTKKISETITPPPKKKLFQVRHSAFDHDKHYVRKQVWLIKDDTLKYHKKNCYVHTGKQILFSIFLLTVYITTTTLRLVTQSCRT
jgi:hypothetical protein